MDINLLVAAVMTQVKSDVLNCDATAIFEMLTFANLNVGVADDLTNQMISEGTSFDFDNFEDYVRMVPEENLMGYLPEDVVAQLNEDITQQSYLEGGGDHCPACKSDEIEGGSVQVDTGSAWQSMNCNSCEATWNAVYNLVSYSELKK